MISFLLRPSVVLAAALAAPLAAGAPLPFWQSTPLHKAWTRQDGAPSAATAIAQDRTGMLWFAAADGLFRFDGVRFNRITEINGNKLSSPNVRNVAVFGDALWVGYAFGGISVFEHGQVRHYRDADGLPGGSINQLGQGADGTIWLSSTYGMYWLDGARWRRIMPDHGWPADLDTQVAALEDGSLLATRDDGVFRMAPGSHRLRKVPGLGGSYFGEADADGSVILKKYGEGISRFDPTTETVTPIRLPSAVSIPYTIFRDRRSAWWLIYDDAMHLYDPGFQLKQTLAAPQSFSGTVSYTRFDDREGNLWFATENGVDRFKESRLIRPSVPTGNTDFSVTASPSGEVWVGSSAERDNHVPRAFAITPDGRHVDGEMPSPTASLHSADGSLWFGDFRSVWRRHDGKIQRWPLASALQGKPVQAMAMASDGRLWVSVVGRGVQTLKDGVWQPGGGHAELATRTAISLHADAHGRIWIGYPDNAMAMVHQGKIQQFGPADGLAAGNILTMSSRHGMLWVGGDQGLARFDHGRFVTVSDIDSRPFAGVSGIVETVAGELWLHNTDGLIRIGATDLKRMLADKTGQVAAERFDYLDGYRGMPALMRPLNSLVEAANGRLWYGNSSGVGWIDPQRIERNRLAPTPLITSLHTDSQRFNALNGVGLPQHTRNLQIDYTAAVLSVPERARFRTRLIGQDHAWRDSGGRRQAFYTNLGPGDYRFEVMAANEDGVWSVAPASLSFRIAPAFYQTIWFKLACVALLAGGLQLLHLRRLSQMTARVVERMRTRLDERERIARALHDTYLQSVQGLILHFNSIKAALPNNDVLRERIDAALDVADAVVDEGREQLMDLRASHTGDDQLATALETAGLAAGAQHGVAFSLRELGQRRALHADAQTELFAIAREALINAMTHSGSKEVAVQLSYGAASFALEVRDHGKGLDDEVRTWGRRERHWGLTGMHERATRIGARLNIQSAAGAGTTIAVTLRARLAYR